ncbi:MAG TPA: M20/M25/M40 family metallo-hydrolase [Acidimicrobiales bacterium]|jgi:acetylornithine deacetylase/succinyl-diaminopimelate desuccinylase-like protein|nr:M20/M25/M40 family metallo-hydrolase [Acidimicrobiales bacterium]
MIERDRTAEVTDLLQHLIRNRCVNDGTPASGQEIRNADLLRSYLEGPGVEVETYEPVPGRRSLLVRIEGSDPDAPAVCFCGHTDVVPVSPDGWSRDPFGGELVDGEVWGRGALDMLNMTAAMAVATKELAATGWRPRGTYLFLAVADEEAGGKHGARWLVDNEWDDVGADYLITESGGLVLESAAGRHVTVTAGEKGVAWRRLRVRGTPGHGSMPFGTDNALVKAAEVIRRLAAYRPKAGISDLWRAYVQAMDLDDDVRAGLVDPSRAWDAAASIGDPRVAKFANACTHMTFSPNVVSGGVKTNVIPDVVDIDVDIRILPGDTGDDVAANLTEALGDLAPAVEVETVEHGAASSSPVETPMWDAIGRAVRKVYPEASLVPRLTAGGTDARFYREKGTIAYGAALFTRSMTVADFTTRFHGHDERVDVASLGLTASLYLDLAHDVLGG